MGEKIIAGMSDEAARRFSGWDDSLADMTAKGKRLEAAALREQANRLYDKAEALEESATRQEEVGRVVRVEFTGSGASNPYAYLLPENVDELSVEIGDLFVAPATWVDYRGRAKKSIVTVTGWGRGDYTGPLKTLYGRVVPG